MAIDYREYRKSLAQLMELAMFRDVLEHLESVHVNGSVFSTDTNTLIYKLAAKELIQSICVDARTKFIDYQDESGE